jgi:hypothetical protein
MQPQDTAAVEQAAWAAFVAELAEHLAAQWPAMPERLGDRYTAFVEQAVQQADKRGLTRAAAVARYVNLFFVWGPLFHDKPGFEWALGLLAAPREREWNTVHQLVRRSLAELQKMPDARIAPAALEAADARLIERFGRLGVNGDLKPYEPPPAPPRACDLEAAELRLLEAAVTQRYVLEAGQWQRADIPLPPPLRVDAANPLPELVAVLSRPPRQTPAARLQLRARSHAVCDGDLHPAVRFLGTHGLWQWNGHETRALSWPLATRAPQTPRAGPGTAIGEETLADIFALHLDVCGLRDEGDPIGALQTLVWVWPAAQWWIEVQRATPAARSQIGGGAPLVARSATRCRVECDGTALDAAPLRKGFEKDLDDAGELALQRLLAAWSGVAGLASPRLEGALALLTGRAAFTWGWCLGPAGLDGRAVLRLLGELQMQAAHADLQLDGELSFGGARARLVLRCVAEAPLEQHLVREAAEPPLLAVMNAAKTSFRLPFAVELVPQAGDSGALLQLAGPCTGALVGEAGLRPRTSGGSGFEWFASLRVEPAIVPLTLVDPLTGSQSFEHPLLGAVPLLDWGLG